MAALAMGHTVDDHQSFLGNGGLQSRRLTNDSHIDVG